MLAPFSLPAPMLTLCSADTSTEHNATIFRSDKRLCRTDNFYFRNKIMCISPQHLSRFAPLCPTNKKVASLLENNHHSQLVFFHVETTFAVINAFALYDTWENLQSLACGYRCNRHSTCNRHNMHQLVHFVRRRN